MILESVGAAVMVAGSALFLVGAFLPVSRIYVTEAPADRLALIAGRAGMWTWHLALMGSGSVVTVAGLALVAARFEPSGKALFAYAAVSAAAVGTFLWARHVQLRFRDPSAFAHRALPAWHFATYSFLMQAALAAFGAAALLSGLPSWMAAVGIGGAVVTFIAYLVFHDVPPFVYYELTLTIGMGL